MVVTYDEWGGFYDHVPPPRIADDRGTPNDPGGLEDFGQIGFRVPSTIISPWTRGSGAVDHTTYDHASVVRFIQDNWDLPNLTLRSASTNSIEHAFRGFQFRDNTTALRAVRRAAKRRLDSSRGSRLKVSSTRTVSGPDEPGRLPSVERR